jgi:hypothetical protein
MDVHKKGDEYIDIITGILPSSPQGPWRIYTIVYI